MSEKLFKFLLSELSTVRIICGSCGVVTETSIDKLESVFKGGQCPSCKASISPPLENIEAGALGKLSQAIRLLGKENLKVEFVLPDNG